MPNRNKWKFQITKEMLDTDKRSLRKERVKKILIKFWDKYAYPILVAVISGLVSAYLSAK